jgi:predicted site-specific integrase-resolvase
MKTYSTKQVAEDVGVHRVTLQRWLLSGKLPEPERLKAGGMDVRIWNDLDIERVRKYKLTQYRKGRGRKKTSIK